MPKVKQQVSGQSQPLDPPLRGPATQSLMTKRAGSLCPSTEVETRPGEHFQRAEHQWQKIIKVSLVLGCQAQCQGRHMHLLMVTSIVGIPIEQGRNLEVMTLSKVLLVSGKS